MQLILFLHTFMIYVLAKIQACTRSSPITQHLTLESDLLAWFILRLLLLLLLSFVVKSIHQAVQEAIDSEVSFLAKF